MNLILKNKIFQIILLIVFLCFCSSIVVEEKLKESTIKTSEKENELVSTDIKFTKDFSKFKLIVPNISNSTYFFIKSDKYKWTVNIDKMKFSVKKIKEDEKEKKLNDYLITRSNNEKIEKVSYYDIEVSTSINYQKNRIVIYGYFKENDSTYLFFSITSDNNKIDYIPIKYLIKVYNSF